MSLVLSGLQKLTLLDYPGRVACTVFLGGCDFRCPFCHNAGLIQNPESALGEGELLEFLNRRRNLLDGVVFTGGEPLLQRDLPALMQKVKALGYPIKLDTNGSHPDKLKSLIDEGLVDYVAMDVKNSPERYPETVGVKNFDLSPVSESIEILKSDSVDYEFRTTVVAELHDEKSFAEIGKWIQGAKRYYLQKFVNRESVLNQNLHAPDDRALSRYLEQVRPYVSFAAVRGEE